MNKISNWKRVEMIEKKSNKYRKRIIISWKINIRMRM